MAREASSTHHSASAERTTRHHDDADHDGTDQNSTDPTEPKETKDRKSAESFSESVSNSLTRLKNSLRRHLSQQWTELTSPSLSVPAAKLPEKLAAHATEVTASKIPESVLSEIAESLNAREDHANTHTTDESQYNFDNSLHLPLGARFKPRGIFEDDWSAHLSEQRPWPVILIHGTVDTKGIWQELGTELRQDGWCVFAPDYGKRGTAAMQESALQLGAYIEAVRTVTGAEQVILIGHSQGGLLARYWLRTSGNPAHVKHLVSLSAPNHGTTMGGILSPLASNGLTENIMHSLIRSWFGPVGFQQITGSEIFEVFDDKELDDGVSYTCLASRQDTVVQPPETCFLNGPEDRVRNVWVQDIFPRANVQHQDMPINKYVRALIRTGLDKELEHSSGSGSSSGSNSGSHQHSREADKA